MKKIFVSLLLLPLISANAQDCKFEVNEVDNFTHTRTVITTPKQIALKTEPVSGENICGKDVSISIGNIKNIYLLYINLKYKEVSAFFHSPQKNGMIMLDNDSIVPITGVFEGFNTGLKGNSFTQKFTFTISYETILLLEKYSIKEIRIVDMELNQKVDIIPAKGKENIIKHMTQCVYSAMMGTK